MDRLLDFIYNYWHIDQLSEIPYEMHCYNPNAKKTYHLNLPHSPTFSDNNKTCEETFITVAIGQFEPNIPLVAHINDGTVVVCIDQSFINVVELFSLAYYVDSITNDGVRVDDHDIYMCALILAAKISSSYGEVTRRPQTDALETKYASKIKVLLSFIEKCHILSDYIPTIPSKNEFVPEQLIRVIFLHEMAHIIFKKYRPWLIREAKHLKATLRKELELQRVIMKRNKVFRPVDYGFLKEAQKFCRYEMPEHSPAFTELFCDYVCGKGLLATESHVLADAGRFEEACFAAASSLDAIVKVSAMLNVQVDNVFEKEGNAFRKSYLSINVEYALRQYALGIGLMTASTVEGAIDVRGARVPTKELAHALGRAMDRFIAKRDKLFFGELLELTPPHQLGLAKLITSKVGI